MSRTRVRPTALASAVLGCLAASCLALAAPPAELPQLPPPGKTPVPTPLPAPDKVPVPLPLPKAKPPAGAVPVTLIPVEMTVSVADIKKQMLRNIVLKLDPNADPAVEPVLPLIVKTNDPRFAPAPADPKQPAVKPVEGQLPVPLPLPAAKPQPAPEPLPQPLPAAKPQPVPQPLPEPVPQPLPVPGRPRIIQRRPPEARPLLDRIAERPIVRDAVQRVVEGGDMLYVVDIRCIDIAFKDNTLVCEVAAGFHSDSKSQPGDVREATFRVRVTKDLVWSDAGRLEPRDGSSKVWIDPSAPLVGFPRLDIARVIQLNALLDLVSGVLDRELMKRLPTETMPDLTKVGPQLNGKVPFLALQEITAYPLKGDDKNLLVPLVLGFVPAAKKVGDEVTVATNAGKPPAPQFRGQIEFDKTGKPNVKLEPAR